MKLAQKKKQISEARLNKKRKISENLWKKTEGIKIFKKKRKTNWVKKKQEKKDNKTNEKLSSPVRENCPHLSLPTHQRLQNQWKNLLKIFSSQFSNFVIHCSWKACEVFKFLRYFFHIFF